MPRPQLDRSVFDKLQEIESKARALRKIQRTRCQSDTTPNRSNQEAREDQGFVTQVITNKNLEENSRATENSKGSLEGEKNSLATESLQNLEGNSRATENSETPKEIVQPTGNRSEMEEELRNMLTAITDAVTRQGKQIAALTTTVGELRLNNTVNVGAATATSNDEIVVVPGQELTLDSDFDYVQKIDKQLKIGKKITSLNVRNFLQAIDDAFKYIAKENNAVKLLILKRAKIILGSKPEWDELEFKSMKQLHRVVKKALLCPATLASIEAEFSVNIKQDAKVSILAKKFRDLLNKYLIAVEHDIESRGEEFNLQSRKSAERRVVCAFMNNLSFSLNARMGSPNDYESFYPRKQEESWIKMRSCMFSLDSLEIKES